MKKDNKKIKYLWSVLCESSAIDSDTNNISLFNILEEVQVQVKKEFREKLEASKKPFIVPKKFELVIFLEKLVDKNQKAESFVKVKVIKPKEKQSKDITTRKVTIEPKKDRFRLRLKFNGIEITDSGEYKFEIYTKESKDKEFVKTGETKIKLTVSEK